MKTRNTLLPHEARKQRAFDLFVQVFKLWAAHYHTTFGENMRYERKKDSDGLTKHITIRSIQESIHSDEEVMFIVNAFPNLGSYITVEEDKAVIIIL